MSDSKQPQDPRSSAPVGAMARPDIAAALRRAAAAQRAGRHAEAEQICRSVLSADPGQADALFQLAGIAAASGRPAASADLLRRAITADPRRPEFHGNLGAVLKGTGQFDAAAACFAEAIRLAPTQANGHIALGNLLQEQGDLEGALASLRRAIDLEPANAAAHFNLGNALRAAGRRDEAAASLNRTIRLRPDLAEAHINLGVVMFELNRLGEAEAALQHALRLQPDNPLPQRQLALVQVAAGRIDEAAKLLLETLQRQRRPGAPVGPVAASDRTANRVKLRHDADQLAYLATLGCVTPALAWLVGDYERALAQCDDGPDASVEIASLPPSDLAAHYNRLLHFRDTPALPAGALGQDWDGAAVEAQFRSRRPGFAWFDGLLTPTALRELHRFCLESTVWFQTTFKNEVSATLFNGLCCPLLFQIANELRQRLPGLLARQPLALAWAYKYCGDFSGLGIHADDGAVSVNFWITPDDANLDPDRGGLVLWDREVPEEYLRLDRAKQPAMIQAIVDAPGTTEVIVPYRCNRALVFHSMIAHSTDRYRFKEGYENRRINITLLYGHAA